MANHLWLLQLDSSMGSLCADNLFVSFCWGPGEKHKNQLAVNMFIAPNWIQYRTWNLYFFDCSSHLDTFVCPLPLVGLKLPWDLSASAWWLKDIWRYSMSLSIINSNNCDSNIIFETASMFRTKIAHLVPKNARMNPSPKLPGHCFASLRRVDTWTCANAPYAPWDVMAPEGG